MPGSGDAITMYYALAAGPRAVLERCWPGSMLGSAGFVRCRSGLVLGFLRIFYTSSRDTQGGRARHTSGVHVSSLALWSYCC